MMYSFQVKYKMLEELVKHSLLRADTGVRPYIRPKAALRAVDFSICA
jgi:hypothetical protein